MEEDKKRCRNQRSSFNFSFTIPVSNHFSKRPTKYNKSTRDGTLRELTHETFKAYEEN